MRKPMIAAVVIAKENDWSDFAVKGGTEPSMRCAIAVELVDDTPDPDDVETLRNIEAALALVESERPSAPDIDTCLNPKHRSDFPLAEPNEGAPVSR